MFEWIEATASRQSAIIGGNQPAGSRLLFPAILCVLVFLAGCGGPPVTHPHAHAEDWESPELPKTVVAAPVYPIPGPPPPLTNIPAPAPAPAQIPSPAFTNDLAGTWVPLDRWCQSNGLETPERLGASPQPSWALRAPQVQMSFRAGSQVLEWNGMELHLGFAPQWHDRQPYVHALDLRKTVVPLLNATHTSEPGRRQTIVIDPGHGGVDAGARSVVGGRLEKDLTLDWARRLESLLSAAGCQVFLTRRDDRELSLPERVAFATAHRADLFVSLHFNSAGAENHTAGLETYCLTPAGMPSTVTRNFSDDPRMTFPNNRYDAQNIQLALRAHRALLEVNGHRDRGVRRARFLGVLQNQTQPSVLVEGGYLTNPQEARRIADPAYRQQLAEALAKALTGGNPRE
jgi:N-acetylmuramoyl-L-alanine amidase